MKRRILKLIFCFMVLTLIVNFSTFVYATGRSQSSQSNQKQFKPSSSSVSLKTYEADTVKTKLEEEIDKASQNFYIDPDLEGGTKVISPFKNLANQVVGIIIIIVLIALSLFTALDLLYIGVPPLREFLDKEAEQHVIKNGDSRMFRSTNVGDSKSGTITVAKLRFISDDAVAARFLSLQQGEAIGNMLGIYIKRRFVSMILTGFAIYLLFSGNFWIIAKFLVNVVEPIFEAISKAFNIN